MRSSSSLVDFAKPALDGEQTAREAGLVYVRDTDAGLSRVPRGKGFSYRDAGGKPVRDEATLARIRRLAIPPAWTDVWICASPRGHIQATGRDARRRKQYRYHGDWQQVRDADKYQQLIAFAGRLPRIRRTIRRHMSRRRINREKILATVVHLLEVTLSRIGNRPYSEENGSHGLTTLSGRHVAIAGSVVRFRFRGKSGKEWRLKISDRRIARVLRELQELPGQHLFQYEDADGTPRPITSGDVNAYLGEIAGADVTAKIFRTWAGTVRAVEALAEAEWSAAPSTAKRHVRAAIVRVAEQLGNTPAVCRACYVHPDVIAAYQDGELRLLRSGKSHAPDRDQTELTPWESATLRLLRRRRAPARKAAARAKRRARRGATSLPPPGTNNLTAR